jgi:hypothetical protein
MVSKKSEKLQWGSIELVGFAPKTVPIPEGKDARKPRIANKLYLGHFPKEYRTSFGINGIQFKNNKINFNIKARDHFIPVEKDSICFVIELEQDTIQFIELDDMLDSSSLKILDTWITNSNEILLSIANEYEQYNRQFYHFMYDVIALSKAISRWEEKEQKKILNETKSALILLHNRIQAEITSEYRHNGERVMLFPPKPKDTHKPDMQISDVYADVKTIIIPGLQKNKLLKNFVKRLEKIILEEQKENQIGKSGTFFVGIWSGFLSSIFYTSFKKFQNTEVFRDVTLCDTIPSIEKEKIIFVLPTPKAFFNYYLVVERSRAIRISNFIYKKAFEKIQKADVFSYLTLINVRKGCSFGLTGKNPMIIFKLT